VKKGEKREQTWDDLKRGGSWERRRKAGAKSGFGQQFRGEKALLKVQNPKERSGEMRNFRGGAMAGQKIWAPPLEPNRKKRRKKRQRSQESRTNSKFQEGRKRERVKTVSTEKKVNVAERAIKEKNKSDTEQDEVQNGGGGKGGGLQRLEIKRKANSNSQAERKGKEE